MSLEGTLVFSGIPHQHFGFIATPPDIKSLLVMSSASHLCQLRENEGIRLSEQQRLSLNTESTGRHTISKTLSPDFFGITNMTSSKTWSTSYENWTTCVSTVLCWFSPETFQT
ncbi:hypothetical protein CDAR_213821 [Caerostris darwini]|uniref:Uncharacterized protein n=1 Tax=Caerostris darwini TaxID=1538125 RepID=A0AAV4X1B3_9ARAC|nr:hypothetical protein CDAR_213821 [Caerostris darwini]